MGGNGFVLKCCFVSGFNDLCKRISDCFPRLLAFFITSDAGDYPIDTKKFQHTQTGALFLIGDERFDDLLAFICCEFFRKDCAENNIGSRKGHFPVKVMVFIWIIHSKSLSHIVCCIEHQVENFGDTYHFKRRGKQFTLPAPCLAIGCKDTLSKQRFENIVQNRVFGEIFGLAYENSVYKIRFVWKIDCNGGQTHFSHLHRITLFIKSV